MDAGCNLAIGKCQEGGVTMAGRTARSRWIPSCVPPVFCGSGFLMVRMLCRGSEHEGGKDHPVIGGGGFCGFTLLRGLQVFMLICA